MTTRFLFSVVVCMRENTASSRDYLISKETLDVVALIAVIIIILHPQNMSLISYCILSSHNNYLILYPA